MENKKKIKWDNLVIARGLGVKTAKWQCEKLDKNKNYNRKSEK